MTPSHPGADYADPVVIPITLTIPDPRPRRPTGMSRLRRAVVMPANGWPGRPTTPRSSAAFYPADLLGIPSARAQELPHEEEEITRRSPGGRPLSEGEEFRLELYIIATRRLRDLEPNNPELSGPSTQDYIPDDQAVARRQQEAEAAEARFKRADDLAAGRRQLDPADVVAPGGKPVGSQSRPGRGSPPNYIRTVPQPSSTR